MAIVKGSNAIQLVRQDFKYDPTQQTSVVEREYIGSVSSALGLYNRTAGGTTAVNVQVDGGVGRVITQTPTAGKDEQDEPRYEVAIEYIEKDIFQIPAVAKQARDHDKEVDTAPNDGSHYFREICERVARTNIKPTNADAYPLLMKVVRLLRDGVTGYEVEYVVIKRTRKVSRSSFRRGGIAAIGDGLVYYSTAQLGLPNDVFFSVPDTDALDPISDDYAWGWRRRPGTSSIQGSFVEQSSEFILSQWSTLAYSPAGGPAGW